MGVYYPNCRVRIVVRFDELGDPSDIRPLDVAKVELGQSVPTGPSRPDAISPTGQDPLVHSFDITQVVECTVNHNGLRIADTATIRLNFADLPFDPRMIRYAGVEVFMGAIRPAMFPSDLPVSREVLRFVGKVDEAEIDLSDETILELKCRDFTALFIDEPSPNSAALKGTLLDVLRAIINSPNAPWAGLGLEVNEGGQADIAAIIQSFPVKDAFQRGQQGPTGADPAMPQAGAASSSSGSAPNSTWDFITRLCFMLGLVARVGLNKRRDNVALIVGPPRAFLAGSSEVRRMVYGRNLKSLKLHRKFSIAKPQQILVNSYNPSTKQTVHAFWPKPDPKLATDADAKNTRKNAPKVFPIPGLASEADCERVARSVFDQLSKQELGGSLETDDLTSFSDATISTDDLSQYANTGSLSMLDTQDGDAIEITIAPSQPNAFSPTRTLYGELLSLSTEALSRRLVEKGYTPQVAGIVSRYLKGGGLEPIFVIRSARHRFSKNDGYSFGCEFVNYVQIRWERLQVKQGARALPPKRLPPRTTAAVPPPSTPVFRPTMPVPTSSPHPR